jgi:hypothetical protein
MVIKQYKNVNGIKAEDLDIETALIKENLLKSISFYTK